MATADLLTPKPTAPRRDPSPRLWTDAEFARMQQLGVFAGRDVELIGGTVIDRHIGKPFIFTRKEYSTLGDNHFFRDQRVQLIGGVIWERTSRMTPKHATVIRLAMDSLDRIFGEDFDVRCQLPINLGLISEPAPAVSVVTGSPRDYLVDHPKTALLVIEVSDSMLEEDTHEKASLYASGGIEDYWVIDLRNDRVLVFRSPKPDPNAKFGKDYSSVSSHKRDDKLTPLAAPNARVPGSELLP
jgi:Uma2 family endonuclease